MKSIHKIMFSTALLATTGAAVGVELGVNTMNERELPVLVQVSSKGKVTRVLPAVPLSPALTRALRDTIQHWVTGPATSKNMRPIGSQMIMRVALFVEPLDNGKYEAHFSYVSRQAAASASGASFWRWNGNQLALVTDPNGMRETGFIRGYGSSSVGSGVVTSGVGATSSASNAIATHVSSSVSSISSVSSGGGGHGGGKH